VRGEIDPEAGCEFDGLGQRGAFGEAMRAHGTGLDRKPLYRFAKEVLGERAPEAVARAHEYDLEVLSFVVVHQVLTRLRA
jgi:hypothetical protein